MLFVCLLTHNKKAELQSCCSATQGSGIALNSEQTTLSPRRYIHAYTRMARISIIYTNEHLCAAMLWNL
jgi:hypothetical protein